RVLRAQLAALAARLSAVEFTNIVDAGVIRAEMKAVKEDLDNVAERQLEQTVVANASGQFLVPAAADLPGHFLLRGTTFGYVQDPGDVIIRAVVDQAGMGAIERGVKSVSVWEAGLRTRPRTATVARVVPGGHNELPHRALAADGGGTIVLDPRT